MLRVERSMRRTPRSRSSWATRLLSFDLGSPVARDAAEKPPWRTTCAKYCRSFRSCTDASRLTYRFSQRNSVSVTCCLQVAPPKGQVRVVASTWEPAMPMRRCEMKKGTWDLQQPRPALGRRWLSGPTQLRHVGPQDQPLPRV